MFKVANLQNPRANVDRSAGDVVQVIGAGLPRTGTTSLVAAMEILGFAPAYHFTEVMYNPEHAPIFDRLLQAFRITGSRFAPKSKEESDAMKSELRNIFRGYKSTFDAPACYFIPEFMELYPHAKVLLSVRDSDEVWFKSIEDTISVFQTQWYRLLTLHTGGKPVMDMSEQCTNVRKQDTEGEMRKEQHSLHNQRIREIVPKEKFLEFNVKHGWGPLCEFLQVPVPDEPFPRVNDTKSMHRRCVMRGLHGAILWLGYLGLGAGSLYLLFNPQKATCLFNGVAATVAGILGWAS